MVLTEEEVKQNLEDSDGWETEGEKWISKTYELPSFPKAVQFIQSLAEIAEDRQHHPYIVLDYKNVTVKLSTHDQGGLTQKDFESAHAYDRTRKKYS